MRFLVILNKSTGFMKDYKEMQKTTNKALKRVQLDELMARFSSEAEDLMDENRQCNTLSLEFVLFKIYRLPSSSRMSFSRHLSCQKTLINRSPTRSSEGARRILFVLCFGRVCCTDQGDCNFEENRQ